jgi:hypothetical protein
MLDSRFLLPLAPGGDDDERSTAEHTGGLPTTPTAASSSSPCSTPRPDSQAQTAQLEQGLYHRRAASFGFGRSACDCPISEPSELAMSDLARRTHRPPDRGDQDLSIERDDQALSIEPSGEGTVRRRSFVVSSPSPSRRHISTEDRYASPTLHVERSRSTPPSSVFPPHAGRTQPTSVSLPVHDPPAWESIDRHSWASELGPSVRRDTPVLQRPPVKRRTTDRSVQAADAPSADESKRVPSNIVTDVRTTTSTDCSSSPSREFSTAGARTEGDTDSPLTPASVPPWHNKHPDPNHQHAAGDDISQRPTQEKVPSGTGQTPGIFTTTKPVADSTVSLRSQHDHIHVNDQPRVDIEINPSLRQPSVDKDTALDRALRTSTFTSVLGGHSANGADHWVTSAMSSTADEQPASKKGLTINTDFPFETRPRATTLSSAGGEGLHVDQGGLMGAVELGSEGGHFGPDIRNKVLSCSLSRLAKL